VSCHGAHDILPASNPSSRVNPSRLAETCGRCHPGAGKSFPIGRVHLMPSSRQGWALLVLRRAYQAFVCLTLLGFLGYILLDLVTYWRLRRAGVLEQFERRLTALPAPPGDALLRMTRIERWQHNLLIVAFTLLALTGFPVVFPRSLFAQAVMALCGGDHGRAFLHRVSAVGLVALAVVHGLWLVGTPRGRKILRRLLPAWADVRNAWETALLFFGRTTERPRFGWFSFLEKFEYFALCWGTFIMTLSGVVMWFVDWSLSRFPKWALDASEIFHRWEAILAVLAILVWHLYHTLWKPGVYPGNHAWLTGHLTVEEFARDHPLEYEAATGRSLVEPKPPEHAPKAAEKASEEADEGRG
jgi:cytochrome b subunit of formate dehydrogenase